MLRQGIGNRPSRASKHIVNKKNIEIGYEELVEKVKSVELHDEDILENELNFPYRQPKHYLKIQVHYKDQTLASDLIVMSNKLSRKI